MRIVVALVVASALSGLVGGEAHRKTERGNRHYAQGEYDDAMAAYTEAQVVKPDAPELQYDLGNVFYRKKDFSGAAEAFGRAQAAAGGTIAGHAAYNLGNALYRQERFDEAAAAFRRALKSDPKDNDAKRNLELTLRAIEEQKKQKQQQQQQQKQQQQQEPKKQDEPQQQPSRQDKPQKPDKGPEQDSPDPSQAGKQEPQPAPGKMSAEDARRLLDRLADQEKGNAKREAKRRAQPASPNAPEKDW